MSQQASPHESNSRVIFFVMSLSLVCALILSTLASVLKQPQERAKELDRSEQMMIAAHLLSPDGYFLMKDEEGEYIPAKYTKDGSFEPGSEETLATSSEILEVFNKRILAVLVDRKGNIKTFSEAGINKNDYLSEHQKSGYFKQPLMLLYEVLPENGDSKKPNGDSKKPNGDSQKPNGDSQKPNGDSQKPNGDSQKPISYVIPVNGFGLWDAIYGYLAVSPDGNDVVGITWYDQKETPGLGANIADPSWQAQFSGKHLFQESAGGTTDFKTAPLGITVVKGKVSEVYGTSPKALSAVDGMPGATLTGNGVTAAYKDVLAPYRPFLIKLQEENAEQGDHAA